MERVLELVQMEKRLAFVGWQREKGNIWSDGIFIGCFAYNES